MAARRARFFSSPPPAEPEGEGEAEPFGDRLRADLSRLRSGRGATRFDARGRVVRPPEGLSVAGTTPGAPDRLHEALGDLSPAAFEAGVRRKLRRPVQPALLGSAGRTGRTTR